MVDYYPELPLDVIKDILDNLVDDLYTFDKSSCVKVTYGGGRVRYSFPTNPQFKKILSTLINFSLLNKGFEKHTQDFRQQLKYIYYIGSIILKSNESIIEVLWPAGHFTEIQEFQSCHGAQGDQGPQGINQGKRAKKREKKLRYLTR